MWVHAVASIGACQTSKPLYNASLKKSAVYHFELFNLHPIRYM